MFSFGFSFGMLWCREFRNHRRTMEKPQHWKFETKNISLCIFDSFTAGSRPRFHYRIHYIQEVPPCGTISEFKGLRGWHNSSVPKGQHIIWTHVWPPIIWTHVRLQYYMNTCMTSLKFGVKMVTYLRVGCKSVKC